MKYFKHSWTALFLVLSLGCTSAMADRIKDLTTVAAMRATNSLVMVWWWAYKALAMALMCRLPRKA